MLWLTAYLTGFPPVGLRTLSWAHYLTLRSLLSIFLAYLPLPHPPKLTGANAFQLFEHTAEIVQLSDAAFQTDFFYTFVGKPQHPLRMGDPHLLQVSNQRHTKAVCKIPNRVTTQASS